MITLRLGTKPRNESPEEGGVQAEVVGEPVLVRERRAWRGGVTCSTFQRPEAIVAKGSAALGPLERRRVLWQGAWWWSALGALQANVSEGRCVALGAWGSSS